MDNKDNLNYIIENDNVILGNLVSKFSLIFAIVVEIFIFGVLFLPLTICVNWISGLIAVGIVSLLNIFCAINWSFFDVSIYQNLFDFFRYKGDFQKIKVERVIKANICYEDKNTIAFIYENKIIIKSYFEISLRQLTNTSQIEEAIREFQVLLQENNFRCFSINSNFDVKENIEKFNELIENNVDFKEDDVLAKNTNKLLIQQLADFVSLNESLDLNNINVIEFNREYAIDKNLKVDFSKPFYKTILQNFKMEEVSFRTSVNNYIQMRDLNLAYLESVKNNLALFKQEEVDFKYKYYVSTNSKNEKKYTRILKLNLLAPQLEPFYLIELFNNQFNYETSLSFVSLTEEEENKIYHSLEQANNSTKFRAKRFHKKSTRLKQELTSEILANQMIEVTTQDLRTKALSFLIKVQADSSKELIKRVKELKSSLKRKRIKFKDLMFLQKQAFFDFHLGVENKIKKNGKERKNKFKSRKLNNLNCSSIWLTSHTSAYSLPFREWIDVEPTGWIYGNDLSNNPVAIDFDINRPNHHTSIFGKSGTGKTTISEYLLNQKLVDKNGKKSIVIILDPKNEYENIVKQYGGQTFNIAKGFANPFKRNDKEITEDDLENVEMFLDNLLKPLQLDKASSIARLSKMIFNSIEWKQNNYNFDVLTKHLNNSKELKEKLGNKDFSILFDYLSQYNSKGIKSHLFNQKVSIDIDKKVISFNFSKLISTGSTNDTDTLIFSVLGFLNNLMRKNDPKFKENQKYSITIMIDEFHLFMNSQNNSIIKQFDTLYAISRSFGVGIVSVTQNLENLNNPLIAHHSRSIFANTAYFIVFQQDATQYEHLIRLLPEHIAITEEEKAEILSDTKHQALVFYNNQKKFLKLKLGLFYDETRDENSDGFKQIRIQEYKHLKSICDEYIQIKKGELNAK